MSMTPFTLQASLSYFFLNAALGNRPSSWEVRLHTGNPGAGATNEVNDSGYVRPGATFEFNGPNTGVTNAADLNFGTAANGFTVTHVSVWDSANAQALVTQRLANDKVITAGAQIVMAAGELTIGGAA